jgi:Zn-dependent protease with chaperone function
MDFFKRSRLQLQGVIGHEFSHIRKGDMQVNIRLIQLKKQWAKVFLIA